MKITPFLKRQNSVFLTTLIGLILIGILICLPTGYEDALIYQGTERAVGKVVETDNSAIITSGLIQSGEQSCMLEIENGNFKAEKTVHHTHEGSIGNLCTDEISALMQQTLDKFHFDRVDRAETELVK